MEQEVSETDNIPLYSKIVVLTVSVTTIISASASLWVIGRLHTLPANKVFLYSLIISDFLQACVSLPLSFTATMLGGWLLPPPVWLLQVCCSSIMWIAGIYSLALMNIDHYICVTNASHYLAQLGSKKSVFWIIFVWALAFSYCIPFGLLGSSKVVSCSTELMYCLFNHDYLAAFSATCVGVLMPPPIFLLVISAKRGLSPHRDDILTTSPERSSMYKANTISFIMTLALWIIGLVGTFSSGAPPVLRHCIFWLGLSAPLWRMVCYAIIARTVVKQAYTKTAIFDTVQENYLS